MFIPGVQLFISTSAARVVLCTYGQFNIFVMVHLSFLLIKANMNLRSEDWYILFKKERH